MDEYSRLSAEFTRLVSDVDAAVIAAGGKRREVSKGGGFHGRWEVRAYVALTSCETAYEDGRALAPLRRTATISRYIESIHHELAEMGRPSDRVEIRDGNGNLVHICPDPAVGDRVVSFLERQAGSRPCPKCAMAMRLQDAYKALYVGPTTSTSATGNCHSDERRKPFEAFVAVLWRGILKEDPPAFTTIRTHYLYGRHCGFSKGPKKVKLKPGAN